MTKATNDSRWLILTYAVLLVILFANDHYFKGAHPGLVTGKVSDIAGLAVFPVFLWLICLRDRKVAAYVVTAVGFIWYKSPAADFLIN